MKTKSNRGKINRNRKAGAFLLAEAVEIANYYWQVKHIDNYFYKKWCLAEERLDNLLDR